MIIIDLLGTGQLSERLHLSESSLIHEDDCVMTTSLETNQCMNRCSEVKFRNVVVECLSGWSFRHIREYYYHFLMISF